MRGFWDGSLHGRGGRLAGQPRGGSQGRPGGRSVLAVSGGTRDVAGATQAG